MFCIYHYTYGYEHGGSAKILIDSLTDESEAKQEVINLNAEDHGTDSVYYLTEEE